MIDLVLGGQFGSEGKGSVVSWMAQNKRYDLVIRTGGPNAGHTFKHRDGTLIKMRQLPCTWAFQDSMLYVPAGAVVDMEILKAEMRMLERHDSRCEVRVSPQAAVIGEDARFWEKEITTGTTGEGVGGTRAKKCLRKARLAGGCSDVVDYLDVRGEAAHLLSDNEKSILVESTQGYGLSLDGRHYPFVTSANLNPFAILDSAEVPFGIHDINVWMVFRTYPIRIAGNSGALTDEISWEKLRERHGKHVPVEQTTVTKKTRRVGEFNGYEARLAMKRCHPNTVVLTFVDYVFPKIKETRVTPEVAHFLHHKEAEIGGFIHYLGVGIGELMEVERRLMV